MMPALTLCGSTIADLSESLFSDQPLFVGSWSRLQLYLRYLRQHRRRSTICVVLRAEMHDNVKNTHKFYEVLEKDSGEYLVRWGRIGSAARTQKVTETEANKRWSDKLSKGYSIPTNPYLKTPIMKCRGVVAVGDKYMLKKEDNTPLCVVKLPTLREILSHI